MSHSSYICVVCAVNPAMKAATLNCVPREGGDVALFLYLCYVCSESRYKVATLNCVP